MKDKVSWEELLDSEGRSEDGRWARLVSGLEAEIEAQVRQLAENPPAGGANLYFVRGERCRNLPNLFQEWGNALDFPDYSGHNWDAFGESLEELVEQHDEEDARGEKHEMASIVVVLVANSLDLLRDEPEEFVSTLIMFTRMAAFGLAWEKKDRPRLAEFRTLFQCKPGEAELLKERLTHAGLNLQ